MGVVHHIKPLHSLLALRCPGSSNPRPPTLWLLCPRFSISSHPPNFVCCRCHCCIGRPRQIYSTNPPRFGAYNHQSYTMARGQKTERKQKSALYEQVTREYTINLHKRTRSLGWKHRAPTAIKEIRKFAEKTMGPRTSVSTLPLTARPGSSVSSLSLAVSASDFPASATMTRTQRRSSTSSPRTSPVSQTSRVCRHRSSRLRSNLFYSSSSCPAESSHHCYTTGLPRLFLFRSFPAFARPCLVDCLSEIADDVVDGMKKQGGGAFPG